MLEDERKTLEWEESLQRQLEMEERRSKERCAHNVSPLADNNFANAAVGLVDLLLVCVWLNERSLLQRDAVA